MEGIFETIDGKLTMVSKAWQLPMPKMIQDLETRFLKTKGSVTPESMRVLYSHAYNPRRNEGFFASKIVLVEGPTEEYSLPIYADALSNCAFDPQGVSVVECGGKGAMDRLFRIFNELRIPCFMLFDYDKDASNEDTINKSAAYLCENPDSTYCAPHRITLMTHLTTSSSSSIEQLGREFTRSPLIIM
jgi:predicted ATP-dependent endonuclease of OLD family